jgi:gluconate kinase
MSSSDEVLLVGGRAGVGKTSVAAELHHQFAANHVRHALIEGDNLDMAWPAPWKHGLALAEANLHTMWRTYTKAGYTRLIYTNTACVRADVIKALLEAIGETPLVHGVLLTGTRSTVAERLGKREIGSALELHIERSQPAAAELGQMAPAWVRRSATDGRSVADIARDIAAGVRWATPP